MDDTLLYPPPSFVIRTLCIIVFSSLYSLLFLFLGRWDNTTMLLHHPAGPFDRPRVCYAADARYPTLSRPSLKPLTVGQTQSLILDLEVKKTGTSTLRKPSSSASKRSCPPSLSSPNPPSPLPPRTSTIDKETKTAARIWPRRPLHECY